MRGRVSQAGRGQAGCEVRLCDLAAGAVVAVTSSDADGGYEFDVPRPASALLVARCTDEAIGLAGAEPAPDNDGTELTLESAGRVHPVTVAVRSAGPEPPPPDITLALEPLTLSGAPEVWLAAARAPAAGITRRWFATPTVSTGRPSVLRMQAGRWQMLGRRIGVVTAHAPELEPEMWSVEAASVDGRPVELTDAAFELEVAGPTRVDLQIAPSV